MINPMLMMQQMFGSNTSNMNPMAAMMRQIMSQNQGQLPSINPQQFISIINNMSQDEFINLANQARIQGMSENEIQNGMNFIQGLINK